MGRRAPETVKEAIPLNSCAPFPNIPIRWDSSAISVFSIFAFFQKKVVVIRMQRRQIGFLKPAIDRKERQDEFKVLLGNTYRYLVSRESDMEDK